MIKALIVEDEDLAAKRLEDIIAKVAPDIQITGRTNSIEETVNFLRNQTVDLMFLDINLSDGYSFKIFEKNNFKTPPIIFTTAYSEYAIKAFKHNSISYLLKPIEEEGLKEAIEKFKHLTLNTEDNTSKENINYKDILQSLVKPYKERFLIKTNLKLESVNVSDISYFYSEDQVTFLMLKTGKAMPIDYTLKALEQELDPKQFYRINRKYFVHLNSIQNMYYASKSRIKVELNPANKNDNELVFVAIEKVGKFKKWLSV